MGPMGRGSGLAGERTRGGVPSSLAGECVAVALESNARREPLTTAAARQSGHAPTLRRNSPSPRGHHDWFCPCDPVCPKEARRADFRASGGLAPRPSVSHPQTLRVSRPIRLRLAEDVSGAEGEIAATFHVARWMKIRRHFLFMEWAPCLCLNSPSCLKAACVRRCCRRRGRLRRGLGLF